MKLNPRPTVRPYTPDLCADFCAGGSVRLPTHKSQVVYEMYGLLFRDCKRRPYYFWFYVQALFKNNNLKI